MARLPLDDPDDLAAAAGVKAPDADLRVLLRAGPRLTALVRAPAPTARGAHLFRAVFADAACGPGAFSATGCGCSARAALARCLGEAVETLAQAPRTGDVVASGSLAAPPQGAGLSEAERRAVAARGLAPDAWIGWVAAVRLPDETPCLLPAPLVLRGAAIPGAPPLSLGCAAGPDEPAARRAAALELFERAAVASGREAALDFETARAAAEALTRLRAGAPGPRAALREITAPGGPPTIRARSALGVGTAAGETKAEAARAALREMIAAESAAVLDGAAAQDAPEDPPPVAGPLPAAPAGSTLADAVAACAARGFPLRAVRLTRPDLGASVVKIVCFGLSWPGGPT